ncbi:MAG: hypothetical protein NUW37_08335 [Planctomycetes bacterium]|nr:hypothetical protein [Planctomycetota bacterium]
MAIPDNIQREDIEWTMTQIDNGRPIPDDRKIDNYYIERNSKKYPIKFIVSLSNENRNNVLLPAEDFHTDEAKEFLKSEKLGYHIHSVRNQ